MSDTLMNGCIQIVDAGVFSLSDLEPIAAVPSITMRWELRSIEEGGIRGVAYRAAVVCFPGWGWGGWFSVIFLVSLWLSIPLFSVSAKAAAVHPASHACAM